MDFLDSVGALRAARDDFRGTVPAPGRHDGATRPPHLAPSASPTPPRPRRLGGAGARDSDGACVPFSRLGLHQSERCGHPTDDVRGPVPAPGQHDGRDAASASHALGQPYTAAAPSPRWCGHPRPRRRPRPFPRSRTSSVIARDHIRLVRRAVAAAGRRTHPAGAPLVRRRPRAVRAAPPPPP